MNSHRGAPYRCAPVLEHVDEVQLALLQTQLDIIFGLVALGVPTRTALELVVRASEEAEAAVLS